MTIRSLSVCTRLTALAAVFMGLFAILSVPTSLRAEEPTPSPHPSARSVTRLTADEEQYRGQKEIQQAVGNGVAVLFVSSILIAIRLGVNRWRRPE